MEVWKTSLAAEYPTGLCWAWAKALKAYLESAEGKAKLAAKSVVVEATKLTRASTALPNERVLSNKEKRDWENSKAVGVLRDPYRAVLHRQAAWKVGARVRSALLRVLRASVLEVYHLACNGGAFKGFSVEVVCAAAAALAEVMNVEKEEPTPLRVNLLTALLDQSKDPERSVQRWLKEGFPLGIDEEIEVNDVFPITEGDAKAVEASKLFPLMMEVEAVDAAENYRSFQDAGAAAIEELERVAREGYATKCASWAEVVAAVGQGASLTRVGCLQNTKPDGSVKTRLVVACRRSGINGLMAIRQRVVSQESAKLQQTGQR